MNMDTRNGKFHFLWQAPLRRERASQVALVVKNLPASAGDAGDTGSVPGLGRSPARGNDNPLRYSYLGNPTERGAWQALEDPPHRISRNWM